MHRSRVDSTPWAGVHLTCIESARCFARHAHETFGVGLMEHGAQRSASGRGEVEARAGEVITTNPGEVHDGRPLDAAGRRWRMVYLEPAVMADMSSGGAAPTDEAMTLAAPVIADPWLSASLRHLFAHLDEWHAASAVSTLACDEALVELCHGLQLRHVAAPRRADQDAPAAAIRTARDRLAADDLPVPTLADLAEAAGLGRYQLLRRFAASYGMPPHAWLLQRRVERARRLLAAGSTIVSAAIDSGFADQSHLTRAFVRRFGYTPGAWQRAAQR